MNATDTWARARLLVVPLILLLAPACAAERDAAQLVTEAQPSAETCWGGTTSDYPSGLLPGEEWTDHFPDEAGAIAYLIETVTMPRVGILGPIEPTEEERRITEAKLVAYTELERDDDRSTDDRAIWVGPRAEVVLGRTENGWRVESDGVELPAEVCQRAREDRALRHPGSDPEAEERARARADAEADAPG